MTTSARLWPLTVCSWLAVAGLGMALAALASDVPPSWDALSYVQKARTFWDMVSGPTFVNPFDLQPTVRPPGTTLVAYPFGFTADFHWFHFRTVFLPTALLVAAVYVAGAGFGASPMVLAALALAAGGMPLLYQFAPNDLLPHDLNWGMVDNFMAAVAAVAFACTVRGVARASIGWSAGAGAAAALCLLIKPSGAFIMVLVAACWAWLLMARVQWQWRAPWQDPVLRRFATVSIAANAAIYLAVTVAAFTSAYFSVENLAFGNRVIAILKSEISVVPTAGQMAELIQISIGWIIALLLAAGLASAALWREHRGRLVPAVATLLAGLWFWLVETEPFEPRYFAPFALGSLMLVVPALATTLEHIRAREVLLTLIVAPTLIITALLFHPAPPLTWQKTLGVSLVRDQYATERQQAEAMIPGLAETRATTTRFYLFNITERIRSFLAVFEHAAVTGSPPINVALTLPIDWQRPSTYRFDEMLAADYLVFEPVRDEAERARRLAERTVSDFYGEARVVEAWFTTLGPEDGVLVQSDTGVRVLTIVDRSKLSARLEELRDSRTWPPAFVAANGAIKKSAAVSADVTTASFALAGAEVIVVRAVSVRADGAGLGVDVVLDTTAAFDAGAGWQLFGHLVDAQGNMLGNSQTAVSARTQRYRLALTAWPTNATHVALGFFRGSGDPLEFLTTSAPASDWSGRRLLVPTPPRN